MAIRKLVTIKKITDINPIPDADAIEVASVGGWKVVVKKGEFSVGDDILYFEIDSFLPESDPIFAPFAARGSKNVKREDGTIVTGHVLRTAKLRGQVSQGLILSLADFPELSAASSQDEIDKAMSEHGVFKWEPVVSASMGGEIVGAFPADKARKTDSERVQNLSDDFLKAQNTEDWFATEKVDGTSATFIMDEDGLRAASRNWEMDFPTLPDTNVFVQVAKRYELASIMPVGAVIQGEIFGPGIQGNPLKKDQVDLLVFTVLGGDESSAEFDQFVAEHSVPVLDVTFPRSVDEAVEQADGLKSALNKQVNAEGIVWWNKKGTTFSETGDRPNFKAINNKFLLKQK